MTWTTLSAREAWPALNDPRDASVTNSDRTGAVWLLQGWRFGTWSCLMHQCGTMEVVRKTWVGLGPLLLPSLCEHVGLQEALVSLASC